MFVPCVRQVHLSTQVFFILIISAAVFIRRSFCWHFSAVLHCKICVVTQNQKKTINFKSESRSLWMVSYPQQVAHKHWEANWQGSRPQSSISPLIRHSKDHNHELQSQEYLYSGGHSQTDAWLKLKAYIYTLQTTLKIVIKYIYCPLFYLCEIAFLEQALWWCFDISTVSNIDP